MTDLFVFMFMTGGGGCTRVLATHGASGGLIIHQDYTLINIKH